MHAFHCFSVSANARPIDTSLAVLLLSFSTLCLAVLHSFSPSPLSTYKKERSWMAWGWSEYQARVQWRVEKVAQTWYKKQRIFIQIGCVLHHLEFVTPCLFHFSTAASLHSLCFCSKKSVRGWKGGEKWKEVETRRGLSEVGVMGGITLKGLAEGWGDPTSSFIAVLQASCHIHSGCALI